MLVPRISNHILRIKVISQEEFDRFENGEFVLHGGFKYISGIEDKDTTKYPGVVVSTWSDSNGMDAYELSYDFSTAVHMAYGDGYGGRDCSPCVGINGYHDARNSSRPHPSPFIHDSEIDQHQYFNNSQQHFLLQAVLQKQLKQLGVDARRRGRGLNAPLFESVENLSSRVIITCGKYNTNTNASIPLGFANTSHLDSNDVVSETTLLSYVWSYGNQTYYKCMLEFVGFCRATTCGYQHLYKLPKEERKDDFELTQFFSYNGLGLAIPILHGSLHAFMAASFSHQTCVAVAYSKTTKRVRTTNWNNEMNLFAWGATSGESI